MNVFGLVTACSLLLGQVSVLIPSKTATETAPLRVFRDDAPRLQKPVYLQGRYVTYTPEDFKAGVQGAIALEVTVGPDGRVRDAIVANEARFSPAMEDRAIAALSDWRFQPGTLNGQTVAVRTTVSFTLSIR
jgi:TonB family protein